MVLFWLYRIMANNCIHFHITKLPTAAYSISWKLHMQHALCHWILFDITHIFQDYFTSVKAIICCIEYIAKRVLSSLKDVKLQGCQATCNKQSQGTFLFTSYQRKKWKKRDLNANTRTTNPPAFWDTPAAPWLPILGIQIRSHVKTRQSQSYKF